MRELTCEEINEVSGGIAFNVAMAGIGAIVGGALDGAEYAVAAGDRFSWGEFAGVALTGAVSGALMGSGMKLLGMAARGTPGVAVAGGTLMGAGASLSVATKASSSKDESGGS